MDARRFGLRAASLARSPWAPAAEMRKRGVLPPPVGRRRLASVAATSPPAFPEGCRGPPGCAG
eukprot:14477125-Alexandrium_andersonii.AAC.1